MPSDYARELIMEAFRPWKIVPIGQRRIRNIRNIRRGYTREWRKAVVRSGMRRGPLGGTIPTSANSSQKSAFGSNRSTNGRFWQNERMARFGTWIWSVSRFKQFNLNKRTLKIVTVYNIMLNADFPVVWHTVLHLCMLWIFYGCANCLSTR